MRIRAALLVVAVTLGLAGCAASPLSDGHTPAPSSSPSPSPEPSPSASVSPAPLALDPAPFATQIPDRRGDGIDFDSADGNVHCGIWSAYDYAPLGEASVGPVAYAGCRPAEASYETDPSSLFDAVGCRGGELSGVRPPAPVCNNGQAFVGEAPQNGPVGVLHPGESLSYAGFTCTSPETSSIECVRLSDGAGFMVGRIAYRYF
ncbi:MAG: hypothetical protein QM598_00120 [Protaetiibacter sp.]